ncbi:hypothetical protein LLG95_00960 [bacterium]|nr:hypothetical protein [bacterium]
MTRAFHVIAAAARAEWGRDIEIFGAHGLGRSFGAASSVLFRALPGILECGMWRELERMPDTPTRAVITDVGNDILFGHEPGLILEWIDECVRRLRRFTNDITLATLPMESIYSISRRRFLFFRSIFFPSSRMTFEKTVGAAEEIERGLEKLIQARGIRRVRPRAEWYHFDPIHIRPGQFSNAWREILGCDNKNEIQWTWPEAIRLYLMKPEQQWIMGKEQFTPQRGIELKRGGRVWLY